MKMNFFVIKSSELDSRSANTMHKVSKVTFFTPEQIHAPLIVALLGTSQLTIDDWIQQAVAEEPDKESKLYKYICKTGGWNKSHILYWAYGHPDCEKVLTNEDFSAEHLFFEEDNRVLTI